MGNEIDSSAHKASNSGFASAVLVLQCSEPKIEYLGWVEVTGKQPFFRLVETDRVAQFGFTNLVIVVAVINQRVSLGRGLHRQGNSVVSLDGVALSKAHPSERSVGESVFPSFVARLEYGDN